MVALARRRQQLIQDSIIADFPTALHFLRYNDKFAALDPHDREQKLIAHKKAEDDKNKQVVTAIIQPAPRSGRGRSSRGGRSSGRPAWQDHHGAQTWSQPQHQQQQQFHPGPLLQQQQQQQQPQQHGYGLRPRGRGHGGQ
jgi:hypothetical protein